MFLRYRKLYIALFVVVAFLAAAAGMGLQLLTSKLHTTPRQLAFEKPFAGRDSFTILVLGEDENYQKKNGLNGRTDTIILAAIDLKDQRASAISIPRDSRVQIPGRHGFDKINAAYVYGGPQLTAQTVANLLGIQVDYYVKTNIAGLKKVVDTLGGVEIDIEKNMYYVDRRGGLYINLKKGHRHLDGDKALQYVRFRHDTMGDLWRVERQQKFLKAIARRMAEPENWTKLPQAIDEIMANLETNLTGKDLLALARLSKDIPLEEVKSATLPGTTGLVSRVSYYLPDNQAIMPMVDEILRFQTPKPTVAVLNGSGMPGAAERFADVLRSAGYRVVRTADASSMDYTDCRVLARDPENAQARAIADQLNCQPVSLESGQSPDGASVVVIVGRNYL